MSHCASPRRTAVALAAIGLVLLLNGAWYFPLMVANRDALMSEYGGHWIYQTFYIIQTAVAVALAVLVPRLRGIVGRTGRSLPGWLILALHAFTILQAATLLQQAFVVPHLARVAPSALDNQDIDAFALSMMTIWAVWGLLVVTLGVVGAVRRVVPVPAAVAMAIGALGTPMLGPGGWGLVGAGLAWWAIQVLRAKETPSPVAVPAGAVAA